MPQAGTGRRVLMIRVGSEVGSEVRVTFRPFKGWGVNERVSGQWRAGSSDNGT